MPITNTQVPGTQVPSHADQADLVGRLRLRRPGAFEELLDLYQQPIFRFVYRLLNDPSETADVTQEVFTKIFLKIGKFRGDCSLKTWIYRIALNEASNQRRWFGRHRRRETLLDAVDLSDSYRYLVSGSETPFDVTYRREQLALIERVLRKMDARLRCVVILRDIEGLSYGEIAHVLHLPLGTVKSRILRGRETLRCGMRRYTAVSLPEGAELQTE